MPSQKKSKQVKTILIIVISALLLGWLTYFLIFGFFNIKTTHKKRVIITNPETVTPKPVFRRDGTLSFIEAASLKNIATIDIEIADNHEERMMGLMYRDTMHINHGMLFIFDTEEPQSFWMRNTYIPLDIIYANSSRKIVKIHHNTKIKSDDPIPSEKPSIYVVEVNGGFCKQYNIKEGDIIKF